MPYSVVPRWRRQQPWELATWRTRGITLLNTKTLFCQAICRDLRAERQLVRQEQWPCFLGPETTDDRRPTTDDLKVLFFGTAALSGTATVERRPRAKCI
ncbi:hypothetical protein MGU_01408 [Metarhizium guizhouense ARSEF 977]|uniref:Uncharacterized protein n=1 Tax=Metarhizium guizhouense (strain ARSEF 977) TaxID=1276136 RepID=A0A0B4H7V0_METGA|nr:hypothetical protein MGU_01408 [Metarhizium guizhouense ARSEF 977]